MRLSKCFKKGILCEYALVNGDCISEDGCHKFDIAEKLIETSSWHTGTPTEEGLYLIACRNGNTITYGIGRHYKSGKTASYNGNYIVGRIVAYQKIEPYDASTKERE